MTTPTCDQVQVRKVKLAAMTRVAVQKVGRLSGVAFNWRSEWQDR